MPGLILFASDCLHARGPIVECLRRHGHRLLTCSDGGDLLRLLREHQPDAVVLDTTQPLEGYETARRIRVSQSGSGHLPMMLIGPDEGLETRLRALQLGVDDYLARPVLPEQVAAHTDALLGRFRTVADDRARRGIVHAYYGAKGGVGATTLAVNTAIALRRNHNATVALVDANLHFGDLRLFLNMKVETTSIVDVCSRPEIDDELVRQVLVRHTSGIDLMLAPTRPHEAEHVSAELHHLHQVVEVLRSMYEYVIVDLDKRLDDHTLDVMGIADKIFVVMTADLPSVKNARLFIDLMDQLAIPDDRMEIVLNRATAATGVKKDSVELALKRHIKHEVINDYRSAIASLNSGTPFMVGSPNSRLAKAVLEFTDAIREQDPASTEDEASAKRERRRRFSPFRSGRSSTPTPSPERSQLRFDGKPLPAGRDPSLLPADHAMANVAPEFSFDEDPQARPSHDEPTSISHPQQRYPAMDEHYDGDARDAAAGDQAATSSPSTVTPPDIAPDTSATPEADVGSAQGPGNGHHAATPDDHKELVPYVTSGAVDPRDVELRDGRVESGMDLVHAGSTADAMPSANLEPEASLGWQTAGPIEQAAPRRADDELASAADAGSSSALLHEESVAVHEETVAAAVDDNWHVDEADMAQFASVDEWLAGVGGTPSDSTASTPAQQFESVTRELAVAPASGSEARAERDGSDAFAGEDESEPRPSVANTGEHDLSWIFGRSLAASGEDRDTTRHAAPSGDAVDALQATSNAPDQATPGGEAKKAQARSRVRRRAVPRRRQRRVLKQDDADVGKYLLERLAKIYGQKAIGALQAWVDAD